MLIKGLQKLSLLDFPDRIACTVFTYGCNFRCPFCHNASLVLAERTDDYIIPEEEFFSFLKKRVGMLRGVCVTGGEPTLMPDLESFLYKIKQLGFDTKLDTNGYRPDVLLSVIEGGLVDYVAMDIKNSREKYSLTTGTDIDISKIEKSVEILRSNSVPHEFRTTVIRELHGKEDFESIGKWLCGAPKYFLQSFVNSGDLINDDLHGYDKNELTDLLKVLIPYIPNAQIRGV